VSTGSHNLNNVQIVKVVKKT